MTDRRSFVSAITLGILTAPLTALAQPAARTSRVGVLMSRRNENFDAVVGGLRDVGYVNGRNASIEIRFYEVAERLPHLAKELVARQYEVIVAINPYAIRAVMKATSRIPIVGVDLESDPVTNGWARSLGRPGGNFTGVFLDLPELGGKDIELLREVVPGLSRLAVLWDANIGEVQFRAVEGAARAVGIALQSLAIQRVGDLSAAFGRASREHPQAMIVLSSPLTLASREEIAKFALKNRLPTISLLTLLPQAGALMAYGPNLADMVRRTAYYVDRILKGANVADLPIERPTKFELVINLKTAKALGLTIPQSVLLRADQVIK